MLYFHQIIKTIDSFVWGPYFLVPILLGAGLFMSIRLRFLQFRGLPHGVALVTGKYDNKQDPGEITHFQALSAALSATIGIGNIAGVATAIHLGGPGALFWMWLTAILNAPLKYAGIALSHKYRKINPDGAASGGPMYYLDRGLGSKFLAVLFAVFTAIASFGIGNMVQSNTVADTLARSVGIPTWVTGLVLAILLWLVIIGGIRRIASVTSRLVPFMSLVYAFSALTLIFLKAAEIPEALSLIVQSAFNGTAATGGFMGAALSMTIRYGVARGLFSNESGLGSASIAHAAAKTKEPVREGLVGQLGPFIDTLLICSMTGLAIITTGAWHTPLPIPFADTGSVEVRLPGTGSSSFGEPYHGTLQIENGGITEDVVFLLEGEVVDDLVFVRKGSTADLGEEAFFNGLAEVREGGIVVPVLSSSGEEAVTAKVAVANGAVLTSAAFEMGLGGWAKYIIIFSVSLFAFTTAISWSYYGDRSVEYLFGTGAVLPYRYVYTIAYFLGSLFAVELIWDLADLANGCMALPNLIGLVLMSGVLARETEDYLSRRKNSG